MLQLLVLALGAVAVVTGLALVSVAAALVVGGVAVCVFALLWDFGGERP